MNKIYILVPLIFMLLFGAYYANFNKDYQATKDRQKQEVEAAIKAKKELDLRNREIAYKAAIEAAAQRKIERDKKELVETAKKEARLQAEELRQKTFDDRKLLREQVDRLKKEVAAVQAEVAKFEDEKKKHSSDIVFLKEFVGKAEANQKYYYELLDKISAADAAKAKADAEAALAAKKTS